MLPHVSASNMNEMDKLGTFDSPEAVYKVVKILTHRDCPVTQELMANKDNPVRQETQAPRERKGLTEKLELM